MTIRVPRLLVLLLVLLPAAVQAQLQTLSSGKTDQAWRAAQLQLLDQQLAEPNLPDDLRIELTAQRNWLSHWKLSGSANEAAQSVAPNRLPTVRPEPTLDLEDRAADLRARLFANPKSPTVDDTQALRKALTEFPNDLGLRQLQLQWLDQPHYRGKYWRDIAEICDRVIALLQQVPQDDTTQLAMAFVIYRQARVRAHALGGLSWADITGGLIAAPVTPEQREQLLDAIVRSDQRIEELVGADAPEFFALRIFALRRNGWTGRALALLESLATQLDPQEFREEQLSMLEALGWSAPVAALKAKAVQTSSADAATDSTVPSASPGSQASSLRPQLKLDMRYRPASERQRK